MNSTRDLLTINDNNLNQADLIRYATDIAIGVHGELNMMHPEVQTIANAYEQGKAVFYIERETDKAIGYCRLIELIPESVLQYLELDGNFPEIYELGTVFVNPQFRGQGVSTNLVNGITKINIEKFLDKTQLLIGTTTSIIMINSLRPANKFGVKFYTGSTSYYDYIEALTCMCNPTEPLGGTGTHISDSCDKRSTIFDEENEMIPVQFAENIPGIALDKGCKLFLSDLAFSESINNRLRMACTAKNISRRQFSLLLRGEN